MKDRIVEQVRRRRTDGDAAERRILTLTTGEVDVSAIERPQRADDFSVSDKGRCQAAGNAAQSPLRVHLKIASKTRTPFMRLNYSSAGVLTSCSRGSYARDSLAQTIGASQMRAFILTLLLGPVLVFGACSDTSTTRSSNPAAPTGVATFGGSAVSLKGGPPDISFVTGTWCGNPVGFPGVVLTGEFAAQSGRRVTGTLRTGTTCGDATYDSCTLSGQALPNNQWQSTLTCNRSGTCQSNGSVNQSQTTIAGTTTCVLPDGTSQTHQFTLVKQ
jgi:hypothetical protein